MPTTICASISAATTQKYFSVARCDGVARQRMSGSSAGIGGGSSLFFFDAYHHTIVEIPANSMMMLTPVQRTVSPVARLPISGSCGQLCVYVTVSFGRFVAALHEDQNTNDASSWRLSAVDTAPAGMA